MTEPPLIFLISPLRPIPGDPGWPADVLDLPPGSLDAGGLVHLERCRTEALNKNVAFAEDVSRDIALAGGAPVAPHLLFPRFLDDRDAGERRVGMRSGRRVLMIADEAWSVLPDWRTIESPGMIDEVAGANEFGVPVYHAQPGPALDELIRRLRAGEVKLRGGYVVAGAYGTFTNSP